MKSRKYIKDERIILSIILTIVLISLILLFYFLFNIITQTPDYRENNIDIATCKIK